MTQKSQICFRMGLACVWLCSALAFAQTQSTLVGLQTNIKFEHFTTEDGLGHNRVTCVLQDQQGFLWVGTLGGLWRYDGYVFHFVRYAHNDSTGLSHPEIQCLDEDSNGNLWIGLQRGGLNHFDRETGLSTRYEHNPADSHSLSKGTVRVIHEDPNEPGVLWIGTSSGLCQMKRDEHGNAQFIRFQHEAGNKNSLSHNVVNTIVPDSSGIFWIGTDRGLDKFDAQTGIFTHYKPPLPLIGTTYSLVVRSLMCDEDGLLWLGTDSGLIRFDAGTTAFTWYRHDPKNPNSISHNKISSICQDPSGNLWIASAFGLNHFESETATFTRYHHDPDVPYTLSHNQLTSLYQDRSGVLWIGSVSGGLNKLAFPFKKFNHHTRRKNVPNTLNDNRVLAILEDRLGRLWVGTSSGLSLFDARQQTVTNYQHDADAVESSLSHNSVTALLEDRMGRIWIGTANGLNRVNPGAETFQHYFHRSGEPNSLSRSYITRLHEGQDGAIWAGTPDGLNKLTMQTNHQSSGERVTLTRHYPDSINTNKVSDNFIQAIYEDSQKRVWIGTQEGLAELEQWSGRFTHYRHIPDDPGSLSYNNVWSIYEDRSGVLWIGTTNMLAKLDRQRKIFTHYDPYKEQAGYGVNSLLEDEQRNLWFSGSKGLVRFDRQTESFRHFDASDGLQSNNFTNAHYKSRSGEMFYGGVNGFNGFFPREIRDNLQVPPVVFTAFKVLNESLPSIRGNVPSNIIIGWSPKAADGTPILQKCISQTEEIVLSRKDNTFTVEFAALDFNAPEKNQYAYKLYGIHDEWIQLGSQRSLTFTNLKPGNYTLRVKGSNNDGVWNEEGASVKITIHPPWWRTRWAYGLYLLFLGAVLYSIRHYELHRLQLRNALKIKNVEAEKLQEVDRLKSRFFASISHEFRTPLTLILGPVHKWLGSMQQPEMKADFHIVQRNAQRLQQLINQLLDLSKLEAGKMTLQARPLDLVELTRMITMTFESLAKQKGIELRFRSTTQEIAAYVERDKLEKIVTNLLSNALKFTEKGGRIHVQLSVSSDELVERQLITLTLDHCILITVKDTGVGIPEDQLDKIFDRFHQVDKNGGYEGTGIGLALVKELVELHHGTISVESKIGKGTTFTICLPLGCAHLKEEESCEAEPETVQQVQDALLIEESMGNDRKQPVTIVDSQPPGQLTATPNDKEVLLIVEDNPDMRAYMRGYLEQSYRIIEAENGVQGLKQAQKHAPDLIISDVMMPEMDGFALCEKLKTDARTSHIPVILLTARASGESKIAGLETGADDYLTKPFDAKELQVRVKNLIEQHRRLQERFRRELLVQPSEVTVTSMDETFLQKAMDAVEAHIDDPDFETDNLAREAGYSRRQLNRKLRALTGQSVREFIRTIRLKRAAQLLQQQAGTVTEIAYEVGFNSIAHFSKVFREQFGVAPSEFSSSIRSQDIDS
ncbi:MAG: two-component regulator propeller domain-containing protein [bacterium]